MSDPDWVMWIITAAGIGATVWIAVLTLRANRRADAAQITATEAYSRALNSQEASSQAQVEALRNLVAKLNDEPPSAPPPTDVQWSLERDGKSRWIVRNVGTATAHNVSVGGETEVDQDDLTLFDTEVREIPPYQYVSFRIDRTFASPPATVVAIEWQDDFGETRSTRVVAV